MATMVILENVIVAPPAPGEKLDFRALFGDDGPVEMEIGCGKGGFILRRAMAFPDRRFFGIEWANKFYRYAADRMVRRQVVNVRLMRSRRAGEWIDVRIRRGGEEMGLRVILAVPEDIGPLPEVPATQPGFAEPLPP